MSGPNGGVFVTCAHLFVTAPLRRAARRRRPGLRRDRHQRRLETDILEGWATTSLNGHESWFTYDAQQAGGSGLPSPPSNEFAKGKLTLDRRRGTGVLAVDLPGAGSLTAADARRALAIASAARGKGRARSILIKTKTIQATAAGEVKSRSNRCPRAGW